MPAIVALAAAYSQIAGGVLLLLGLGTPVGAALIHGTMLVATLKLIGRDEPFISQGGHSWEASFFYFVASGVILLLGPGRFALDVAMRHGTPTHASSRNLRNSRG